VFEKNVLPVSYQRHAVQGSQIASHGLQAPAAQHGVADFIFMFANKPPNGRKSGRGLPTTAQGSQIGSQGLQAIGSQGLQATGSHGSQPGAQWWDAASFAFRFIKNPPNGRKSGRGPQTTAQGSQSGSQGLQAIGSQGLQAIGSHGVQATGSQGLQPFQTTERRPKMPASAVVVAAKITIAVNADNKKLCFIFILLKIRLGKSLATIAISYATGEYRTECARSILGNEKNPIMLFVPILGT
jgi:hypothetical protein